MIRRVALLTGLVLLTGCARDSLTVLPQSELPGDIYGPPSPTPTAELPRNGIVYLVKEGRLVPVKRPLQGVASSLPEALLLSLLQGPTSDTRTAIPSDTRFNEIEVVGAVARVDLSEEFERGGSEELALRLAQVVYTVTEAPEVTAVSFSIDGFPSAVADPQGNPLPGAVTRADYEELAPPDATD